ncbi:MAG: hypothetical protein MJ237_01480 [bacterium]|nr:hypothetical protein [bacterium]
MINALSNVISHSNLGITTKFSNANFNQVEKVLPLAVDEFQKRANKPGQFLNWVDLPKHQLERVDELYTMAENFKNQKETEFLTILGIGGSKHTVEHMLGVNGLNLDDKIKFYSDVDSTSLDRFLARIGGNITNSKFLVASKSGTTYETEDGMNRMRTKLTETYQAKGLSEEDAKKEMAKHFIAVSDANKDISRLRRLSNSENWIGDLYIHDDVGGRFSSLDDHALFTLAYAGMKKEDMIKMLNAAQEMSKIALSKDLEKNSPLMQAAFWAGNKLAGIIDGIHVYLGDMFRSTVTMHAQMQNESMKDTAKSILLGAECMHHTSEAMYNPANKYSFMFTAPADHGEAAENVKGYTDAITKANEAVGPSILETVETQGLGLKPETAGALTQLRAFATVYQEILEKLTNGIEMPNVLESVLQPHVEFYKKNLKPDGGNIPPVVAGRISK